MKKIKLGLSLLMLMFMGNMLQGAIPAAERQALIALYNATQGNSWTYKAGWKTPPLDVDGFAMPGTEGGWYGITVPFPFDHVTGINLSTNNLVGTLPTAIGNLPLLTSLNLNTNTLSGTLPTELGNLGNLTILHLYNNAFTGSLPSTLGSLTHLQILRAHTNQLSGSIPAGLGTMASLQELSLYGNQFTGSLPTELGNLAALQILDIHSNLLSGALPASLGNLTGLKSLLLQGNALTGAIPTEWGGMAALEVLYLHNNQLSGAVPSSLGGLTHLIALKLNDNGLTGSIPSTIGGLTSLTTLDLSRNHFDGVVPTQMGSLTTLQNLALFSNKLEGPLPTSLTALTNLSTTETAIGFNALYTTDGTLLAFLNTKDPDWAATQTVAPTSVTATSLDNAVILVSWLPITYTGHTGGYQVWISETTGGPYTLVGQTADKTVTAMNVTSLTPGHRYYFVVRTHTDVHAENPNAVESKDSTEATAVAWTLVNVHVTGTVRSGTSPLAGVVMTGLPGSPATNASGVYDGTVPADWSGTVTPTLAGHTFTPVSRAYANLTTNQTAQDYAAAFVSYPDRQALTDLYNATGGDAWTDKTGWKTAPLYGDGFAMPGTEGTWHGVTVDSGTHRVTQIALNANGLIGTIPASLSALTSLQGLNLGQNSLSGSIPASLGTILSLQTLYLNNNQLTGSIPDALGSLTGLQQLWLNNNLLTGTIPTTLGGLTNLLNMSLGSNYLTGSIPTQLGSLADLQYLHLNYNQLSGTIPTALGSLTDLTQLLLNNNLLTGTIPAVLGDLTQLQLLWLHSNQLSGALPSSLSTLTGLTSLKLNSNKLLGAIPTTFVNLINLAAGQTDIGYNGLYTSDSALTTFLNTKDPDWSETQTIAPASMTATALDGANILVSWLPITYKANTGGYKVNISQTVGGPYTYVGQTTDKWATSLTVQGLTPGETYYFVVQTHTDAHVANVNAIDSENSAEVSATAWTQVNILVTGTVTLGGAPLAGVVMSGLTGSPATNASGVYTGTVPAGWSGTVTPTLSGYSFTPASRAYLTLTTNQTAQDYAAAYVPIPSRQALIELYNATNGDSWSDSSGWKTPPLYTDGFALPGTEGTWHGIHMNGVVTNINLSSNNLVGTLPESIGSLTGLTTLNLHTNTLSGPLPESLGNLTSLTVLHLYENAFTGSLPPTLGNLTQVFQLKAHTNLLSGSIPASLGTMAGLQELDIHGNQLTGALPTELGNLAALRILDVHSNLLSGALPASLGGLTNLTALLLQGNALTGTIPTEWGGMAALEYLYLDNNQLSGAVPSSLGGLTHLISLRLNDNGLTGSIPSTFGGLTSLTTLNLSRNHFDGVVPTQMGSLTALQNLALFSNKLEGPLPTSLTALTNLSTTETAIGFNALYSSDSALTTFLNTKDPDWAVTQTVAPTSVTATSLDNAVIMVSWLPITYTSHTGGYQVWISETSGGPYTLVGQTADKTVTAMNVTSLTPGHRYYFVVRTHTDVHAENPNAVESKDSTEATAVAWTLVNVHVTGTVLSGTSPLAGVGMTGLPGSPVTNASGVYDGTVPADWSGTVTPTLAGHTFVPASRAYANLTANQTGQNYASSFVSYPDRQTLTDLYNATGGDAWTDKTGWKTAPLYGDGFAMPGTEGTWHGVTVDSGTHRVTQIALNANGLIGTIPASLSALTSLQVLDLQQNLLGGSIPASLGSLSSLSVLRLNVNSLTGTIPVSLGGLANLTELLLNINQLTGAIPTELGDLSNLSRLWLNNNLLTGTIPTTLGSLTNLEQLLLSDNLLTGAIPTQLGDLTELEMLYLNGNQLSGTIPAVLGDLTQLQFLWLHSNQLSGSLPSSLSTLTGLTSLKLNSNKLLGAIPTTFVNLINLAAGLTDIGYNGLYTSDSGLIAFLAAKDPDWSETQTIAPASTTATALDGANILVSWIPITYKANTGGYKVNISQTAGGPYTYVGQTTDKWATSLTVQGLTPGETYYFVVQTHTDAHVANVNAIDSENSAEVSATAWTQVNILVTGTVTLGGAPLAGVVMSGLTGSPATNALGVYTGTVPAGWSGTVTPTLSGYSFTPASRAYLTLTTNQTAQDYAAAYVISPMRQILIDLYNATNGDNWTVKTPGWKTAPLYTDGFSLPGTEMTWYGVVPNGGALGINLNTNNLVGTLPDSLGNLTALSSLNLHTNTLSGSIPASLGNLTNLTVLHLYENSFTGSLPPTLGNLTQVFQLKAHTNQLSGSIPAGLGTMASLQELSIYGNQFTGSLPTELGNLAALQILDVHSNLLSGALPASLGNLTGLKSLLLQGNALTGAIPTEWGGLAALEYLYLHNNQLSGAVPSSLGGLTHLIALKLNDNGLTGSIPSTIGGLTSLTTLDLSRNHFDGVIPTQMGSLTALQNLALFSNKLQGPVPTSLTALTNLSATETAIGFNALYSSDSALTTFLNTKDPDWAATQTVAPSSVTATSLNGGVIMVSWLPIEFISYTGGYKVYMATTSSGPYTLVGQTLDKTVTAMNVTSLTPGQRYYFVVRTITDAHVLNTNAVESGNSSEASAVAWMQVVHVSGTVTVGVTPLAGVVMSGFTIPPVTNASGVYTATESSGWSGTVTPVLTGYTFDPASRNYTTVTTDQAGQDYTATSVAGALTLTSPNGGESWAAGSAHNITWTQTGMSGDVTIDLYKGGVFQKILGTAGATSGTFSWVIASTEAAGTDYTIRIWQSGVSDDSDGNFTLVRRLKVDFNKDGHEDLLWRYYGEGGYNRVWFLGNTEGATQPLTSAPGAGLQTTAKRVLTDPRDLGWTSGQREALSAEESGKVMRAHAVKEGRIGSVDDPRRAGMRRAEGLAPVLGVSDPRQVSLMIGAPEASITGASYLGGADVLPVNDVSWEIVGTGDFNNDTHVDILWRNISTGMNVVWYMNGTEWSSSAEILPVGDLTWQIVGTGDFNNDTHVDILWRNSTTGDNVIWYMNDASWIGSTGVLGVSEPAWQIVGTGDFNNDTHVDILWRNSTSGSNVVWYMNDAAWIGSAELIPVGDPAWQIAGTGDFDNDGHIDVVWRYNGPGGYNVIWYLDGVAWIGSEGTISVPDLLWKIVNR